MNKSSNKKKEEILASIIRSFPDLTSPSQDCSQIKAKTGRDEKNLW
jgi:hypothetical protein